MKTSESIELLCAAMVKAQAAIKPAVKDSVNPHFKSKYADLSAVWTAIHDAMAGSGLALIQLPAHSDDGRVHLTTRIVHSSGQWLEETASIPIGKQDAHGHGSGLTYLRRYSGVAAFFVPTEDDDGNAAVEKPKDAPKESAARKWGADGAEVNKIELDMMSPDEQKKMRSHASAVIDLCNADMSQAAANYCSNQLTTHEEKMAVWCLLPSAVRSAIKKHSKPVELSTQA